MREKRKDPAAVALGRKGGKKRAEKLSAKELSDQGRKAVQARWKKAKKPKGE
jgi:hypothetical protein